MDLHLKSLQIRKSWTLHLKKRINRSSVSHVDKNVSGHGEIEKREIVDENKVAESNRSEALGILYKLYNPNHSK